MDALNLGNPLLLLRVGVPPWNLGSIVISILDFLRHSGSPTAMDFLGSYDSDCLIFLLGTGLGVFEPSFAKCFSLEATVGVFGGSFLLGEGDGVFESVFLGPWVGLGVFDPSFFLLSSLIWLLSDFCLSEDSAILDFLTWSLWETLFFSSESIFFSDFLPI